MSFCLSDDSFSEDEESEKEVRFVLPENRTRFEQDQKCSVCRINFEIPGIVHTYKGTCLFCYRGVCKRCLVSFKTHPETLSKEKICKACVFEFKKLRFFSNKIEECRLEISQLRVEVGLSAKQNKETAETRKEIQKQLEEAKAILSSVEGRKENTIDGLKERLSSLTVRQEFSEVSIEELSGVSRKSQKMLNRKKGDLESLKKKVAEKEKEESLIKERISEVKEKTLGLLRDKYERTEAAGQGVKDLRIEVNSLAKQIEDLNTQISALEQEEENSKVRLARNKEEINILEDKVKEKVSEIEEKVLAGAQEDLENFDLVIENLKKRLALLQKGQVRTALISDDKCGKHERQMNILTEIAQAGRGEKCARDSMGGTACRKCVIY